MADDTRPPVPTFPNPPSSQGELVAWAASIHHLLYRQFLRVYTLFGGNIRWQNLRSLLVTVNVTGPAPSAFSVTHNLGKIPETCLWLMDQPGSIYSTPAQRATWTNETATLTSSVSPATVTLLVL